MNKQKQTKIEQYQKTKEFFTFEMNNQVPRFRPKIKNSKAILKKGNFEDKITLLWVMFENDRYFAENVSEWSKMAKTIERDCDAPVLEWCALYTSTLDWLYTAKIFAKCAKENLHKIIAFEKEFRQNGKKVDELHKPLSECLNTIRTILDNKNLTNGDADKIRELREKIKKISDDADKEFKICSVLSKEYTPLVERTLNIIGGIKSSGVAFTEYYERLGFSNFMPSGFIEMVDSLSSTRYIPLVEYNSDYADILDFIKVFYDKIKPSKRLTDKTLKSIKENINYLLNE